MLRRAVGRIETDCIFGGRHRCQLSVGVGLISLAERLGRFLQLFFSVVLFVLRQPAPGSLGQLRFDEHFQSCVGQHDGTDIPPSHHDRTALRQVALDTQKELPNFGKAGRKRGRLLYLQVVEAMAVDQEDIAVPGGRRLVLLVVLRPGTMLDKPLTFAIKRELKQKAGMTHVPDVIAQVSELPQTHNGKRSERAVQDLLNGRRPRNLSAIRNPETLMALLAIPELKIDANLLV